MVQKLKAVVTKDIPTISREEDYISGMGAKQEGSHDGCTQVCSEQRSAEEFVLKACRNASSCSKTK